jgi:hypothetical protein
VRRGGTHSLLAFGFWLWCAFIAVGAGFIGAVLNCEGGEGCKSGSPSWLQPWTWGNFYVYPEVTIIAFVALVPATAFVVFVITRRPVLAVVAFVVSNILISYAFFAGLTPEGRALFWFGPLVGIAAIYLMSRSRDRFANHFAKPS